MILSDVIMIARLSAARSFDASDVPSAAMVMAIIEHESRARPRLCVNEPNGSSSRGLMQINRPHSRCVPEDDRRFALDYDPLFNVRYGVWLLTFQKKWHREHQRTGDPLALYAGRGDAAKKFAIEIHATIKRYEAYPDHFDYMMKLNVK